MAGGFLPRAGVAGVVKAALRLLSLVGTPGVAFRLYTPPVADCFEHALAKANALSQSRKC